MENLHIEDLHKYGEIKFKAKDKYNEVAVRLESYVLNEIDIYLNEYQASLIIDFLFKQYPNLKPLINCP